MTTATRNQAGVKAPLRRLRDMERGWEGASNRSMRYRSRNQLLTRGELAFFWALRKAVAGRWEIACKVRLADVVTCSLRAWRTGAGSRIAQKHLDFLLCETHSMRIVLAIELDDRSHAAPKRQVRDDFVNAVLERAKVSLLRVRARARYNVGELQAILTDMAAAHGESEPNGKPRDRMALRQAKISASENRPRLTAQRPFKQRAVFDHTGEIPVGATP